MCVCVCVNNRNLKLADRVLSAECYSGFNLYSQIYYSKIYRQIVLSIIVWCWWYVLHEIIKCIKTKICASVCMYIVRVYYAYNFLNMIIIMLYTQYSLVNFEQPKIIDESAK